MICAHSRYACAVEWHAFDHHMQAHLIDASSTILASRHNPVGPRDILGEQIQCQTMLTSVYGVYQLIDFFILERNDRQ